MPLKLKLLPLGHNRPLGWLYQTMAADLHYGFVGKLDQLVPDLFADAIYGHDRLGATRRSKDVGALTDQDHAHSSQFLWWNSETQSHWRDGWLRHALLVGGDEQVRAVQQYVDSILATQDPDGYLGIYEPALRYRCTGENGELWAQTTLLRGLLHYVDATGSAKVLEAVQRCVDLTRHAVEHSVWQPFAQPQGFAGVSHGLMFIDVLDRLAHFTGDASYRDFAVALYDNYSQSAVSETDAQWPRLLDPNHRFGGHGVHTWEHLRAVALAAFHTEEEPYTDALAAFLHRLESCITPSGGPIGDEWIAGRSAHPTDTGYEHCSITELLDSYLFLLARTSDTHWADRAEHLVFNAALGARHPHHPCIAYLKTDNSYSMTGVRRHDVAHADDATQTRYRYSPVHQEAAVCCAPNAGRLLPSYVQSQVFETPTGLAILLYGPARTRSQWKGTTIVVEQTTDYPNALEVLLTVQVEAPVSFELFLRRPHWAGGMRVTADHTQIRDDTDGCRITALWQGTVTIAVQFEAEVHAIPCADGQFFIQRGPLVYALPIDHIEQCTRTWPLGDFHEFTYRPKNMDHLGLTLCAGFENRMAHANGKVLVPMLDTAGTEFLAPLVPMKGTILRRVSFPVVSTGVAWPHCAPSTALKE